jgi:hypothetical protein
LLQVFTKPDILLILSDYCIFYTELGMPQGMRTKSLMMKSKNYMLRAIAALLLISQLAACAKHYHTDNRRPDRHHYRNAGRSW